MVNIDVLKITCTYSYYFFIGIICFKFIKCVLYLKGGGKKALFLFCCCCSFLLCFFSPCSFNKNVCCIFQDWNRKVYTDCLGSKAE